MEYRQLRMGVDVTGTAAMIGTVTSVEIDVSAMSQVQGAAFTPVGTVVGTALSQFQIKETIVGDRHFVASDQKITVQRVLPPGVTSQDVTFFYWLRGW